MEGTLQSRGWGDLSRTETSFQAIMALKESKVLRQSQLCLALRARQRSLRHQCKQMGLETSSQGEERPLARMDCSRPLSPYLGRARSYSMIGRPRFLETWPRLYVIRESGTRERTNRRMLDN